MTPEQLNALIIEYNKALEQGQITKEEYESYIGNIKKINWSAIYDGVDNLEAEGEAYCTTDACMIPNG